MIREKRLFPRLMVSLPVEVNARFVGETSDLTYQGARIVTREPLSSIKLKIKFSEREILHTKFNVIWSKYNHKDKRFIYGVCFIDTSEEDRKILEKNFKKITLKQREDFLVLLYLKN